MRRHLFILIFLSIPYYLQAQSIWIYSDTGTWDAGITAFEQFLNHIGEEHRRVYAKDLNANSSFDSAKAVCFPGGYAYNYKNDLSSNTIKNLRNYIAEGGKYIGICAGAYFAASRVIWEGKSYSYPLALFNGTATGSIHQIAPWDDYTMTKLLLNKNNSIIENFLPNPTVLYYGGPFFESSETSYDTLAVWNEYKKYPAIINFSYKFGKVLLIGPHLEIETNSERDSTDFAGEFNDVESDWILLEKMIGSLLSSETRVESQSDIKNKLNISPNPASETIFVTLPKFATSATEGSATEGLSPRLRAQTITICNSLGQAVYQQTINNLSIQIDISELPEGVYFVQYGDIFQKFMVMR